MKNLSLVLFITAGALLLNLLIIGFGSNVIGHIVGSLLFGFLGFIFLPSQQKKAPKIVEHKTKDGTIIATRTVRLLPPQALQEKITEIKKEHKELETGMRNIRGDFGPEQETVYISAAEHIAASDKALLRAERFLEKEQIYYAGEATKDAMSLNIVARALLSGLTAGICQFHREGGPAVEPADGYKAWYRNGLRHREDGPAIEWDSGKRTEWHNSEGQLHREDGPALELANGSKHWFVNDERHREDGPAIEYADGSKHWYLNGQPHRVDGPAREYANGSKEWWRYGQLHREDGPAHEYANGSKEWWRYGQLHREDGSAIERPDDSNSWWLNGQRHREDGPAIEWTDGDKEW